MTKKKVIMVVSFGTSYDDSREKTIGAVERAAAAAFPDYEVRRAFTSRMILRKLKERGLVFADVEEALIQAAKDGVNTLVVQPTHLMNGYEYTALAGKVESYRDRFETVVLGGPLLMEEEDFAPAAAALRKEVSPYVDGKTAFCYMGHGTESSSNRVYLRLQEEISGLGCDDCYIGTVEAEGYTVQCILRGLGENPDIQALYVDHARKAMKRLGLSANGEE